MSVIATTRKAKTSPSMRDSAKALPVRLIGVREGMGPELLPTVLISSAFLGLTLPLPPRCHAPRRGSPSPVRPTDCTIGTNRIRAELTLRTLRIGCMPYALPQGRLPSTSGLAQGLLH